jgi:deoxyadenosine/deoxycytidine kinase
VCIGAGDLALSQKLSEELQFEKETAAQGEDVLVPAFLQAFKNAGTWAVSILPFFTYYVLPFQIYTPRILFRSRTSLGTMRLF